MKAVIYKEFGAPNVLRVVVIARPEPGPKEVLIQIRATSVTNADAYMRRADTVFSRMVLGFFKPRRRFQVLGTEFSGTIDQIGEGVQEWKVGDEIFGFRGFGTGCYAEYKAMAAKGSLCLKPSNLTFEEAASVVDGATTALFFLRDQAKIRAGQKVLINGASGSIGTFAVQLAKHFGAEVTGVCSTKNIELVQSLGADRVIDYTQEDFTLQGEKYDIVFDTIGKSSFGKCKNILTSDGKYVTTMFSLKNLILSIWTRWFSKKKALFAMSVDKTEALRLIKQLIEAGQLRTIIDRTYSLEQIAEAHAFVETGRKRGNVVITV